MSIYAISDLHLALSIDKPMDVFGGRWSNYFEKLKTAWEETVTGDDCVIIPGDTSWATYIGQAVEDFIFLDRLPGRKIVSKGNHDYWWTTLSKLQAFAEKNNLGSISFLHNNSFRIGNTIICGARGWICPGEEDFTDEDMKIYKRELQRLELSLQSMTRHDGDYVIAALHYPPFSSRKEPGEFVEIMRKFGVNMCIYGHLHSEGFRKAVEGKVDGVDFKLVSADYLEFVPARLDVNT